MLLVEAGGLDRGSQDSWGRARLAQQGACLPASYVAGGEEPGVLYLCPLSSGYREKEMSSMSLGGSVLQAYSCP